MVWNQKPRWLPSSTPVVSIADHPRFLAQMVLDKGVVRDSPEKTDALGVRPVAVGKVEAAGVGSDLRLGHPTDRKEASGHLFLIHLAEKIGLVLDGIDPFEKPREGSRVIDASVVTAGDEVESAADPVDKGPELDEAIAEHVRTRGATCLEFGHSGRHHRFVVVALKWNDFEAYSELLTDRADKCEILLPWAAAEECEFVLEPDLEVVRRQFVPPSSASRANATEESTPPDVRTATRLMVRA